jgi:hypothetical protein
MNEQFAKDFIKAQSEIGTLPKDKKGYGYNYTDFDTVVKTVKPILKNNHLGFCQMLDTKENGKSGVTTILFHESGENIQAWFELPAIVLGKANNAQNIGGAISYIKRYSLCAILGCSSDDDIDCNVPNSNGYTQNNNNNQNNGQNRQGMPNNQNRPQNGQQNNGGYYGTENRR